MANLIGVLQRRIAETKRDLQRATEDAVWWTRRHRELELDLAALERVWAMEQKRGSEPTEPLVRKAVVKKR